MGNSNKRTLPIVSERENFSSLSSHSNSCSVCGTRAIKSSIVFQGKPNKRYWFVELKQLPYRTQGGSNDDESPMASSHQLKTAYMMIDQDQCRIGNAGVHHLTKIQSSCLKNLNILGNGINDEGCTTLKRGNWKLKHLTLNQRHGSEKRPNKITFFGLKHILAMPIVNKNQILETKEYSYWSQILEEPDLI